MKILKAILKKETKANGHPAKDYLIIIFMAKPAKEKLISKQMIDAHELPTAP